MDIIDQAQEFDQLFRDWALRRRRLHREGNEEASIQLAYCIDCGFEITEERLKVKPDAVRCVDCQALHERNYGR